MVASHPLRPQQLCLQLPTPNLLSNTHQDVDFFKSIIDISVHTQFLQQVELNLTDPMNVAKSAFTPLKPLASSDVLFAKLDTKESSYDNQSLNTDVLTKEKDNESSEEKDVSEYNESSESDYKLGTDISNTKVLIKELEKVYKVIGGSIPKRDRMHNNLMKAMKKFLENDFKKFCPEFETASKKEKSENFESWLTKYIENFFGSELDQEFNKSLYQGQMKGFEFLFGSFICKETMKQKISCSREKAYFYGLQKCFKNSSQKKLAIVLKNMHLIYLVEFLFSTNKIKDILATN